MKLGEWLIGQIKEGNDKAKLRALKMARDTALDIVDVITNNKTIIDEAFKAQDAGKYQQT